MGDDDTKVVVQNSDSVIAVGIHVKGLFQLSLEDEALKYSSTAEEHFFFIVLLV
jgi:hypothetical protein